MSSNNGVVLKGPCKGGFRRFIYGGVDASVGDSVLIFNHDHEDPIDINHCHIAKLVRVRKELEDRKVEEKADVIWYKRPIDLPEKISTDCLDLSLDLVLDEYRGLETTYLEHIFSRCKVEEAVPEDDPVSVICGTADVPTFVCRFRLTKQQTLEPLNPLSARIRRNTKTPLKENSCLKDLGNKEDGIIAELKAPFVDLGKDDCEETKENVTHLTPSKRLTRNALLTPDKLSSRKEDEPKSGLRTRRQLSMCEVNTDMKDETSQKKDGLQRKLRREATSQVVNSYDSSTDDFPVDDDLPVGASVSTSKRENEDYSMPTNKNVQDSPKRKKSLDCDDESIEAVHCSSRGRKSLRKTYCEFNDSDEEVVPQKTRIQPARTPKSSKQASSRRDCSEVHVTENARTPRTAKTPRSSKIDASKDTATSNTTGRSRRSMISSLLESHKRNESEAEVVSLESAVAEPTTPQVKSARLTRRSALLTSTEGSADGSDDDFMPRGHLTPKLRRVAQTPKSSKRAKMPDMKETEGEQETPSKRADPNSTPKKTPGRKGKTPSKKTPRTLIPSMPERSNSLRAPSSSLDVVRANLHVSAVPESLPCRDKEFRDIYCFVGGKISDSVGGCMYISGMPGTGKTATVHAVVKRLQQDVDEGNLPPFQFIEVNGLRLTEPRQVFVRILQQLTGEKCTPHQAQDILAKKFTSGRHKAVLLLVDEVDMLRNRRQDVVYNLFDWPSKAHSKLIVLTIANTMDLPERLLMGRVTSRLGLTRLTFQPYNYKQLQEIVTARLQGSDCFNADAVQLVARKVAAVSGDARRALDICRRATEFVGSENESVTMTNVDSALKQMMNSSSIKILKACSRMEQMFLQAIVAETKRTGVEETNFNSVYRQFKSMCDFHGINVPNVSESLAIVTRLGSSRILLTDHGRGDIMQSIFLNVNSDDIHYAVTKPEAA